MKNKKKILAGIVAILGQLSCGSNSSNNGTPDNTASCKQVMSATSVWKSLSNQSTTPANGFISYDEVPDQRAAEYYIDLEIGNQVFSVIADTGSANLIIFGDATLCPNCNATQGYTPSASATNLQEPFKVSYGSGSGMATRFQDKTSLTCDTSPQLATFAVVTSQQDLTSILGLAYAPLAEPTDNPITPFFDQLMQNHQGSLNNVFSMLLCGHLNGSTITLGDADSRIDRSTIQFTPIIKELYYSINAKNIQVLDWALSNGNWMPSPGAVTIIGALPTAGSSGGVQTIVDSGTTMNLFPPQIVDSVRALMEAVSTNNNLNIPTGFWVSDPTDTSTYSLALADSVISQLPTFQITVAGDNGDIPLNMPPQVYLKVTSDKTMRIFSFRKTTSLTILGQAFMENFYIEFDRGNKRLGFAPNTGLCS